MSDDIRRGKLTTYIFRDKDQVLESGKKEKQNLKSDTLGHQ